MAYFDSPKNNAIWEKELSGLRTEKERRKNGTYVPGQAARAAGGTKAQSGEVNPNRIPVTYQQLLKEEKEASAPGRSRKAVPQKEREPVRPQKAVPDVEQGARR